MGSSKPRPGVGDSAILTLSGLGPGGSGLTIVGEVALVVVDFTTVSGLGPGGSGLTSGVELGLVGVVVSVLGLELGGKGRLFRWGFEPEGSGRFLVALLLLLLLL